MALSSRILAPLVSMAATCALAAAVPPLGSATWFEPLDAANSRWIVRAPGAEAELSSGALRLLGRAGDVLNVRLIGASKSAIHGEVVLPARSFYFHGNDPLKWRGAMQHFSRARAVGVYPGVDAVYYQGPHGLEADFIASAGSDYRRIQLQFVGRRIALDAQGNLCDKSSGEILMAAPSAYEIGVHQDRTPVRSRFRLVAADRASFEVHRIDSSRTLVIDPTLSYATYLGGSGGSTITSVERGSDGRVYVAGYTTSVDLPQAVSLDSVLIRPVTLPQAETFVVCYSPDGSTIAYAVYVGGDGGDLTTSLAVDSQGRATVVGYSGSTNFPTTPSAFAPTLAGRNDAFAYRLSADGSALEYSTFLKVISPTAGYLANNPLTFLVGVDASGAATVGGTALTFTPNGCCTPETVIGVTATPGAFQSQSAGGSDVFLLRLSADGSSLQWATYYGGSQNEVLTGMTLDASGDVIVTGTTASNNLPLAHPFQAAPPTVYGTSPVYSGNTAGFFAKFTPDGSALSAASYFGGQSNNTTLNSVALDGTGAIYLAGSSPVSAAPGVTEVLGSTSVYSPQAPAVIVKLDSTGRVPQYMWAYGPLTAGSVTRIRVNGSNGPCILTYFGSVLVVQGALPSSPGYPGTGFVCFADDGKTLQFATLPPAGAAPPSALVDFAINPNGTLVGVTNGATGAPTTPNAPQPAPGAGSGGYVFEIQPDNPAPQLYYVIPELIFAPTGSGPSSTPLTLLGSNFVAGENVLWNGTSILISNLGGYLSTTSVVGALSNAALAALPQGNVQIEVSMPGPGGGVSSPVTIQYVNPAPGAITINPQTVPVGSNATTFTVAGALTANCSITWNGVPQSVSSGPSGFHFSVPASAFTAPGNFAVVASNPSPGGGSSKVNVSVTANGLPAPSVTGPVAVGIGQGGTAQSVTVNFAPQDAVVVWNGSNRPTSVLNSTTLQFVLSQNDVQQMGSAQFQISSGGVLGPAVTAYVGLAVSNADVLGDPARAQAYFAGAVTASGGQALVAAAVPSGNIVHNLDLSAAIQSMFMTDDDDYLWVTTTDGRISRVNVDTFAIDMTVTVPATQTSSTVAATTLTAIPVAGSSSTIVATGADGILRIFDSGTQRGFSSADLYPYTPASLTPVFATPDVVWATVGNYASSCMLRLTYDYTGFSSFAETCNNGFNGPWGLPSPEFTVDAGVTYFQSGSHTLVWNSPRSGYVDLVKRQIIGQIGMQGGEPYDYFYSLVLPVYDLDTEAQIGLIPAAGSLPSGTFVPYSESQALFSTSNLLLLLNRP